MTGELLVSNSKIRELGELIEHQKGFAFKSTEYMAIGHPIVRVTNFTDRSIDMSDCNYLHPSQVKNYKAFFLQFDDVVIATVGSWLTNPASVVGKVIRVSKEADGALLNQNAVRLRANSEEINQKFLFYRLKNLDFQDYIVCTAQGSANQASITLKDIFNFKFYLPPLPEQKAIARILSSLDDKIELNQQMNRTLEAQARAIFKSWFMDFDPVRAKMEGRQPVGMDAATAALFPDAFEESELGMIPKGWEITSLVKVIDIYDSKRVPLSAREREKRRGIYPYYGAAALMDYVDDFLFDGIYILVGEDGSVLDDNDRPVIQYVWGKFWVNNHAHVLQGANGISSEHLMLFLQQTNISPYVNGAVQLKLNQSNLFRIPFLLPDAKISNEFNRKISHLYKLYRFNTEQSRNLATLRDFLLPKLMSGEIRVKEAEKMVGEAT
jgi:type I restriction enzyme, S subunit